MTRSIVVLAALALLLTGCAEQYPSAPSQPTATAGAESVPTAMPTAQSSGAPSPTPAATATAKGATTVTLAVHRGTPPTSARRGPEWYVLKADPAGTSVQIVWNDTSSASCGGVKEAYVKETGTTVVIDLVRAASRTGIVCPMVLEPHRATVTLAAPVGTRQLLEAPSGPSASAAPTAAPTAG